MALLYAIPIGIAGMQFCFALLVGKFLIFHQFYLHLPQEEYDSATSKVWQGRHDYHVILIVRRYQLHDERDDSVLGETGPGNRASGGNYNANRSNNNKW